MGLDRTFVCHYFLRSFNDFRRTPLDDCTVNLLSILRIRIRFFHQMFIWSVSRNVVEFSVYPSIIPKCVDHAGHLKFQSYLDSRNRQLKVQVLNLCDGSLILSRHFLVNANKMYIRHWTLSKNRDEQCKSRTLCNCNVNHVHVLWNINATVVNIVKLNSRGSGTSPSHSDKHSANAETLFAFREIKTNCECHSHFCKQITSFPHNFAGCSCIHFDYYLGWKFIASTKKYGNKLSTKFQQR